MACASVRRNAGCKVATGWQHQEAASPALAASSSERAQPAMITSMSHLMPPCHAQCG